MSEYYITKKKDKIWENTMERARTVETSWHWLAPSGIAILEGWAHLLLN